ncbi:hypothetical protein Tco_0716347 [Tanacetum coccineum]
MVDFISFTFELTEMIKRFEHFHVKCIVREICEVFVDLKLAIRQDLGFIPSGNVVLSSTYVGKILGADQLLVILCYRYQESGIGYWILSMTISGSGVTFLPKFNTLFLEYPIGACFSYSNVTTDYGNLGDDLAGCNKVKTSLRCDIRSFLAWMYSILKV